jgi:hypothetical protein
MKSIAIKIGVQLSQNQGLVDLSPILFQHFMPESFSFENYLRLISKTHPTNACHIFTQYIHTKYNKRSLPTGPCMVYIYKSISNMLLTNISMSTISSYFSQPPTTTTTQFNFSSNTIVNLFEYSIHKDIVTVGSIVTCIIALKDSKDFVGVHSIYTKSKLLAYEGIYYAT